MIIGAHKHIIEEIVSTHVTVVVEDVLKFHLAPPETKNLPHATTVLRPNMAYLSALSSYNIFDYLLIR